MSDSFVAQLDSLRSELSHYWRLYGGIRSAVRSPILWGVFPFALGLAVNAWAWADKAIAVLPNLVGLSFAAYAVVISFGSESFMRLIAGERKNGRPSPYLASSARIAHFILVQAIVLLLALIWEGFGLGKRQPVAPCATLYWSVANFVGCWAFLYSVALGIPTVLQILFYSRMFDLMSKTPPKKTCEGCPAIEMLKGRAEGHE